MGRGAGNRLKLRRLLQCDLDNIRQLLGISDEAQPAIGWLLRSSKPRVRRRAPAPDYRRIAWVGRAPDMGHCSVVSSGITQR